MHNVSHVRGAESSHPVNQMLRTMKSQVQHKPREIDLHALKDFLSSAKIVGNDMTPSWMIETGLKDAIDRGLYKIDEHVSPNSDI